MNIDTKYNIRDEVYFLWDNKIDHGCVKKIIITMVISDYEILKKVLYEVNTKYFKCEQLFQTKEKLINSLL